VAKDISIKILDTIPQIKEKVNVALARLLNDMIRRKRQSLIKELRILVRQWLSEQPELIELRKSGAGTLASELGLLAGTESIITDKIIENIVSRAE
jgi:hypothetical protein